MCVFLSAAGMADEINQLQRPSPACEDNSLKGQATGIIEVVQERMVYVPARAGRHYATEMIKTRNVRTNQRIRRISNGIIYEVPDFLELNILASAACCCPFGWLGLIFSKMCRSAKSEGNLNQAKCFSVTAAIMFALSVTSGIFLITIFVYYRS